MPGEDEPHAPEDAWETAGEDLDLDKWGIGNNNARASSSSSSNDQTNQHLQDMTARLEAIQKVMEEEGKMRRIEFALQNMYVAVKDWVFAYGTQSVTLNANAEQVVQQILFAFRMNKGYDVGKYFLLDRHGEQDNSGGNSGYDKFRTQLIDKLHLLLGKKPRIHISTTSIAAHQQQASAAAAVSVGHMQGQGQGHVLIFYS